MGLFRLLYWKLLYERIKYMLYIVTQYYTSYHLDYKEKLILKKYDIFRFFDIRLFNSQIKKFEEVLSKYLVLMKLNGY